MRLNVFFQLIENSAINYELPILNIKKMFYLFRLKSVTFDKQGFTIEIPKSLAVGDVSIQVLLTAYDHLSPLAKSFHPKQKKPEVVVEVSQPTEEEKKEVLN